MPELISFASQAIEDKKKAQGCFEDLQKEFGVTNVFLHEIETGFTSRVTKYFISGMVYCEDSNVTPLELKIIGADNGVSFVWADAYHMSIYNSITEDNGYKSY